MNILSQYAKLCLLAAAVLPTEAHAGIAARNPLCAHLKHAATDGALKRHAVRFDDNPPDGIVYRFDLDQDGKSDSLAASCGSSTGAECEMVLEMGDGAKRVFHVQNAFRFVRFGGKYFLVWGVAYDRDNKASIGQFRVERVTRERNTAVCG